MEQERGLQSVEDVVEKQLTLRAVVWDVFGMDPGETAKLDEELERFRVLKISMEGQAVREDKTEEKTCSTQYAQGQGVSDAFRTEKIRYEQALRKLNAAGIREEEALLVTEDSGLAGYVYEIRKKHAGMYEEKYHEKNAGGRELFKMDIFGMAVVFYEKDGSGKYAAADMAVQGFEEIGVQFLDRVHKRRNHLPWNILYTKRTCVREISLDDLDALFALYGGEGITDYTEPLFERRKEEEYTKSYIECMYYYYGYGMWVICDRETGNLIGRAGIEHRQDEDGVCMELGYIIGRAYQGKGYAVEVCSAILEYAAQELEIEQMHCFIHPQNAASIRVAEKLGFTRCEQTAGKKKKTAGRQEQLLHFEKRLCPQQELR